MNITKYNTLWSNIQNFPFDEPGAVVNFSQKLAGKQHWSPAFTKRVTEEYRKFIFLCCIAENGASPSAIVDEAWHLHLTYTKSYWIDFCKNTLGKDVHHHPSKGGTDENHKHEEWYKETLQLYETVFGMAPPSDIWPGQGKEKTVSDIPDPVIDNKRMIRAAAVMALPFLFMGFFYDRFFPFHLNGPEFLLFYLLFGISLIVSAIIIRQPVERDMEDFIEQNFPDDATVFQITHFEHGKHRAIQAAIVDLIRRELLTVNKDQSMLVVNHKYDPEKDEQNPLVKYLLKEVDGTRIYYEQITAWWYNELEFSHPALESVSKVIKRDPPFLQVGLFYTMLVVTAVARMIQGVNHDKPIGFLVFEMVLLLVLLYQANKQISPAVVVHRRVSALFKERMQRDCSADSVVIDFSFNGTNAIKGFSEGFILASLFNTYAPSRGQYWLGSNDGGSSCGGSSCGGGGGCGGGGCGGCGGGD